MPLSHRGTFNREMFVWDQATPGVAGSLLATVPCRFVVSRIILDDGWSGPLIWLYVTTASEVPTAPSYGIAPGEFVQPVDFTAATIIADTLTPDLKYICTRRQIFPFSGETYYRFTLVDATLWQGEVPPEDPCETPETPALDFEYDFTIEFGEEIWFAIPVGANFVQCMGVSRTADTIGVNVFQYGGACEEPEELQVNDLIFGEPAAYGIDGDSFRVVLKTQGTGPGDSVTGWLKFIVI